MRFKDFQRGDLVRKGIRTALASFVVIASGAACTGSVQAQAQASSAPRRIVTPSEQGERDSERTEILRQELKRSEEELEGLERHRAEHLGASDPETVNQAARQQARLRADIAALKREMASAARNLGGTPAQAPARDQAGAGRLAAIASTAAPALRWWDVYGARRQAERPAPLPSAPQQALDVHAVGAARKE
ncbi:hypothetical protein [Variovorax atrisoli]|uniref:hypothetical protein n=1 Tax=Variovorax atrisoli TaxID=3394203 RepID=UPI00119BFAC7|nr:hypothetical protein [Variovorax paradoxus]MDR6521182.1 hypothetical protein [Variovorax paradoxus]